MTDINKDTQITPVERDDSETYHNTLLGLSATSFLVGISTALYLSRKQLFNKNQFNPEKHLPLPTPKHSMKHARKFALQTFAIGTCLCLGSFGVFVFGMSRLTGTTNLKDFSQYMKNFVGDELKPRLKGLNDALEREEDRKLEQEVTQVLDKGLQSFWNGNPSDGQQNSTDSNETK